MAVLPTGTVTFLFTDIEGSTRLWERDASAMHSALARLTFLRPSAIVQDVLLDYIAATYASVEDQFEIEEVKAPGYSESRDLPELRVRRDRRSILTVGALEEEILVADFRFYYANSLNYTHGVKHGPGVKLPEPPHETIAQALQKATGLTIVVRWRSRIPGGYWEIQTARTP